MERVGEEENVVVRVTILLPWICAARAKAAMMNLRVAGSRAGEVGKPRAFTPLKRARNPNARALWVR